MTPAVTILLSLMRSAAERPSTTPAAFSKESSKARCSADRRSMICSSNKFNRPTSYSLATRPA